MDSIVLDPFSSNVSATTLAETNNLLKLLQISDGSPIINAIDRLTAATTLVATKVDQINSTLIISNERLTTIDNTLNKVYEAILGISKNINTNAKQLDGIEEQLKITNQKWDTANQLTGTIIQTLKDGNQETVQIKEVLMNINMNDIQFNTTLRNGFVILQKSIDTSKGVLDLINENFLNLVTLTQTSVRDWEVALFSSVTSYTSDFQATQNNLSQLFPQANVLNSSPATPSLAMSFYQLMEITNTALLSDSTSLTLSQNANNMNAIAAAVTTPTANNAAQSLMNIANNIGIYDVNNPPQKWGIYDTNSPNNINPLIPLSAIFGTVWAADYDEVLHGTQPSPGRSDFANESVTNPFSIDGDINATVE